MKKLVRESDFSLEFKRFSVKMSMVATDQIDIGLHLLDLPAEAIALITRYIDVQDLVNLCCTSKSLCTLLDKVIN